MAEWSIAAVLKTVEGHTSGGSNPSLSANSQSESAVTPKVAADLLYITYNIPYKLLEKPHPYNIEGIIIEIFLAYGTKFWYELGDFFHCQR